MLAPGDADSMADPDSIGVAMVSAGEADDELDDDDDEQPVSSIPAAAPTTSDVVTMVLMQPLLRPTRFEGM